LASTRLNFGLATILNKSTHYLKTGAGLIKPLVLGKAIGLA
jgi:hypothetical protein